LREFAEKEKKFLDLVATTYQLTGSEQNEVIRTLAFRTFRPFMRPDGVALSLGYADGFETRFLAGELSRVDVVDGSLTFIEEGRKQGYANVDFHYALFEEFTTEQRYDYVFANYVMEHVDDVSVLLEMVRGVLKPDGLFFVVVPNARALSRQLAVHMRLLPQLKALTPNDIDHGHRRVYDRCALDRDLEAGGFEAIAQGGLMLKFLADFQMDRLFHDKILGEQHVDGLYKLGLEYPDLAGSLFSVCRSKREAGR